MTISDPAIDCSIPCFQLLRMFNSCPTRKINYMNPFNSKDLHEIFMILLSISPYPMSFLILLSGTYFRTTRSILILMMVFLQNFLVEMLKNNLKDPRPNYKCNQHYGNPSNHATFFTCLIVWFMMEYISLGKKYRFKHWEIVLFLAGVYPFVIYSRVYLKYHSIEQIINGIILGVFIGVAWFIVGVHVILKNDNPIRRIFGKFHLKNTISDVIIIEGDRDEKFNENETVNERYQMLLEKNHQLDKLKKDLKHLTNNVQNMEFMKEANIDGKGKGTKMNQQQMKDMYNKYGGGAQFGNDKGVDGNDNDNENEEEEYEEEEDDDRDEIIQHKTAANGAEDQD